MTVLYVKYAGMPYKSEKHYKGLRHFGIVAGYWSCAFVLKLIYGAFPEL